MPKKQTSSRLSTLAAKVMNGYKPTPSEIKAMAGGLLSQDETKGQKQPPKKKARS